MATHSGTGWKGFGEYPRPEKQKTGVELIAEERQRQVESEGWDSQHDDEHTADGLSLAAACYALPEHERKKFQGTSPYPFYWPFELKWWKPSPENRIRELTKAGALIAAEIDRLNRQSGRCDG